MMASQHVPDNVIRQQLASAIQIVVQCARLSDGTRKVTGISEVMGVEDDQVEMQDIFVLERTGIGPRGKVLGKFHGYRSAAALPGAAEGVRHSSVPKSIFQRRAGVEGAADRRCFFWHCLSHLHGRALAAAGYYVW